MRRRALRTIITGTCCFLTLLSLSGLSAAAPSSVVFCRYGPKTGMTTTFQLRTPTRNGSSDTFPDVNSKWDQPRDGGSNPHQGIDLDAPYGTDVFAVWKGWVVAAAGGQVDLYLDLDQDAIKDDSAWATYMHLSTIYVSVDSYIDVTARIGKSGGSPAHLHFGIRKSTGLWAPDERYYPQGWSTGRDLDFVCAVSQSGNVIRATAYAKDDGATVYLQPGDVDLYHRDSTTEPWQEADMTLVAGSQTRWEFNLGTIYTPGSSVRYMIIAERWDVIDPYKWGIFPAKYEQPPAPDPNESWAYDYLTVAIQ